MITEFIEKFSNLASHHQAIVAISVTMSLIIFTWGVEKLMEKFFFPKKPIIGYILAVLVSLLILWVIKHNVEHAF